MPAGRDSGLHDDIAEYEAESTALLASIRALMSAFDAPEAKTGESDRKAETIDIDARLLYVNTINSELKSSDLADSIESIDVFGTTIIKVIRADEPSVIIAVCGDDSNAQVAIMTDDCPDDIRDVVDSAVKKAEAIVDDYFNAQQDQLSANTELFWFIMEVLLGQLETRDVIEYALKTASSPCARILSVKKNGQTLSIRASYSHSGVKFGGEGIDAFSDEFNVLKKLMAYIGIWVYKKTENEARDLKNKPEEWPTLTSFIAESMR